MSNEPIIDIDGVEWPVGGLDTDIYLLDSIHQLAELAAEGTAEQQELILGIISCRAASYAAALRRVEAADHAKWEKGSKEKAAPAPKAARKGRNGADTKPTA